jgi:hypothetical protein
MRDRLDNLLQMVAHALKRMHAEAAAGLDALLLSILDQSDSETVMATAGVSAVQPANQ